MATQADVRKISLALAGAFEEDGRFAFSVLRKGKPRSFAWVWLERLEPKKARVPNPAVLAIRISGEDEKDALIAGAPDVFFTEPHYNGYPAIMVRLKAVTLKELRGLLKSGWEHATAR